MPKHFFMGAWHCTRWLTYIILILLIILASMLTWLNIKPREAPWLADIAKEQIETRTGAKLQVENTEIEWSGVFGGFIMHLSNVRLEQDEGHVLTFNKLRAGIGTIPLLLGKIILTKVTIDSPHFSLGNSTGEELQESVALFPDKPAYTRQYKAITDKIREAFSERSIFRPLTSISMNNAEVKLGNNGRVLHIDSFALNTSSTKGGIGIKINLSLKIDGRQVVVAASGVLNSENRIVFKLSSKGINSKVLRQFIPAGFLPKSDELKLVFNANLPVSDEGIAGVASWSVSGLHTNQNNVSTTMELNGTVDCSKLLFAPPAIPKIWFVFNIKNIPTMNLDKLWPVSIGPDPREWLVENVSSGSIDHIKGIVQYDEARLAEDSWPEELVTAEGAFSGITVKFSPVLDPMKNATAKFKISRRTIAMDGTGNLMKGSIVPLSVLMEKLDTDDEMITVKGIMDGPPEDLKKFLSIKLGERATEILRDFTFIGKAKSEFVASMLLLKDLKTEDINFDINTTISKMQVKHKTRKETEPPVFASTTMNYKQIPFKGGGGSNETIEGNAEFPIEVVDMFGAGLKDFVSGNVKAKIRGEAGLQPFLIHIDADLKDTMIAVEALDWIKLRNTEANLVFETPFTRGRVMDLDKLVFTSPDLTAKGRVYVAMQDDAENRALLSELQLGEINISTDVSWQTGGVYRGTVKGEKYDASEKIRKWLEKDSDTNDNGTAFDIIYDFGKVKMLNNWYLTNASGRIICGRKNCTMLNSLGTIADTGKVDLKFGGENYSESEILPVSIYTDRAGELMKAMDSNNDIEKGELTILGKYNNVSRKLYDSQIIMRDFYVVNSPILGRLFTVASLTGLFDILSGDGISFKKLKADFTSESGVTTFRNLKAYGNALGITADGEYSRKLGMRVDGAIIPSYDINNLLENIPLIGEIIVGKEGEGVIATRYSVRGTLTEPDVSVNPLSMLTPGILRSIWGDNSDEAIVPIKPVDKPLKAPDVKH